MAVASVPEDLGLAAEPDPRIRYRRVLIARLVVVAAVLAVWQAVVAIGWVDAFWISSPVLVGGGLWSENPGGAPFFDVFATASSPRIALVISSAPGVVA